MPNIRLNRLEQMRGALDATRSREAGYNQLIKNPPPIHPLLPKHLRKLFSTPRWNPAKMDNFTEQLVFQAGIDRVIQYIEETHMNQEQAARMAAEKVGK